MNGTIMSSRLLRECQMKLYSTMSTKFSSQQFPNVKVYTSPMVHRPQITNTTPTLWTTSAHRGSTDANTHGIWRLMSMGIAKHNAATVTFRQWTQLSATASSDHEHQHQLPTTSLFSWVKVLWNRCSTWLPSCVVRYRSPLREQSSVQDWIVWMIRAFETLRCRKKSAIVNTVLVDWSIIIYYLIE